MGIELRLECLEGGEFDTPSPAPVCEPQGYCVDDGHPAPPPASHLVMPESGRVTEFKYKSYACESGFSLWPLPPTDAVRGGKFHVRCLGHAADSPWPAASAVAWPTCVKKQASSLLLILWSNVLCILV